VKHQFIHSSAIEIMHAGIGRVDPIRMITDCLTLEGDTLTITTEQQSIVLDLAQYARVLVLGAGKAGASMARGLELVLGDRISQGLISVKYGHTETEAGGTNGNGDTRIGKIRLIEAGHPVPDDESHRAAREIAALAEAADEETLCITLISGGGSALLAYRGDQLRAQAPLGDIRRTILPHRRPGYGGGSHSFRRGGG